MSYFLIYLFIYLLIFEFIRVRLSRFFEMRMAFELGWVLERER